MVDISILNTVKLYSRLIPPEMSLKKVYLFGSYAKGEQREDSDIDIAVVLNNMTDYFETQMQLMRLRRNIDLRIEPHPIFIDDFNEVNPLANEVLSLGIEIALSN